MLRPWPSTSQRPFSSLPSRMRSGTSSRVSALGAADNLRGFLTQQPATHVVMEACGTAHYWGHAGPATRTHGELVAGGLRSALRPSQQDRSRRRGRAARSGPVRRDPACAGEERDPAGPGRRASCPRAVDDDPSGAHQRAPRAVARAGASCCRPAPVARFRRSRVCWTIRTRRCRRRCATRSGWSTERSAISRIASSNWRPS